MASNEIELTNLKADWNANGLDWRKFGNGSQKLVEQLAELWFPDPTHLEIRFSLLDIWARHPVRFGQ